MRSSSTKLNYLLVGVVCIATFFINNEVIMPDIMESRNIVTAREMVYDHNWLIPTMNGELRLEKPPLPTWLTAVAEIISPDSLALQRAMAGLAALLLVFYFWKMASRILRMNPLIPTLILLTCYNIILMGRTASWDIYCHAFMMGGIYHLARALGTSSKSLIHFLVAGLFTGLSIMSKGPVSPYALFLPFLISYGLVYRPKTRGKIAPLIMMSLLALVIGAWWYIYVHVAASDALGAVVEKESGSWLNRNVRPWWYYWQFFLETGIWSILLLTAIFLPLCNKQRRSSSQWLFSVVWMFASLVLLSLMPEKKTRYLLPLLIPAAYTMGCLVEWWRKAFREHSVPTTIDRCCYRINSGLVTFAVAILPIAAWWFLVRDNHINWFTWSILTIIDILLAGYLLMATLQMRPMRLLYGVTFLFVVAECLALPMLTGVINNPDIKSIEATRKIKTIEGVPFYHLESEDLRIEIVYAAHRNIRPVATESIQAKLPCVLLTHKPLEEMLTKEKLNGMEIIPIGTYDDNRRPKGNRRYKEDFIYHVTLLKHKADTAE